jgi:hypothetical protein
MTSHLARWCLSSRLQADDRVAYNLFKLFWSAPTPGTTAAATLEAQPLTSTIIIATLDSLNAPSGDAHQMIPDPNPPPADYPTIGIIDNAAEQSSG